VVHEEAKSCFYQIKADIPQGSVLGSTLYLLYTADISTDNNTIIATYADGDMAIMAINDSGSSHNINLNQQKSIHVTFKLRKVDRSNCVHKRTNDIAG